MADVKIITHGGTAEIYVDGIPMHDKCESFSFEQSALHKGVVRLNLLCHSVSIDGIDADVITNREEKRQSTSSV